MDYADKLARSALADYRRGTQISGGCSDMYPTVAETIREAIAREREACAKIADAVAMAYSIDHPSQYQQFARDIAENIRNREDK